MRLHRDPLAGYLRVSIIAGRPPAFMEEVRRMLEEPFLDVPRRYIGTRDGTPGITVCVSIYCVDQTNQLLGITVHDLETKAVLEETTQASQIEARLQELFQMSDEPILGVRHGNSEEPPQSPAVTSSSVDAVLPSCASAAAGGVSEYASS